jgi:hypothetical protein
MKEASRKKRANQRMPGHERAMAGHSAFSSINRANFVPGLEALVHCTCSTAHARRFILSDCDKFSGRIAEFIKVVL